MGKLKKRLKIPRGVINPVPGQLKPGHKFWQEEHFPDAEIYPPLSITKKKKKKKKNKLKIKKA